MSFDPVQVGGGALGTAVITAIVVLIQMLYRGRQQEKDRNVSAAVRMTEFAQKLMDRYAGLDNQILELQARVKRRDDRLADLEREVSELRARKVVLEEEGKKKDDAIAERDGQIGTLLQTIDKLRAQE